MTHLPILCEENSIPYVFVSSKDELGLAAGTKRATSVIMVSSEKRAPKQGEAQKKTKDYSEDYEKCEKGIKEIAPVF